MKRLLEGPSLLKESCAVCVRLWGVKTNTVASRCRRQDSHVLIWIFEVNAKLKL